MPARPPRRRQRRARRARVRVSCVSVCEADDEALVGVGALYRSHSSKYKKPGVNRRRDKACRGSASGKGGCAREPCPAAAAVAAGDAAAAAAVAVASVAVACPPASRDVAPPPFRAVARPPPSRRPGARAASAAVATDASARGRQAPAAAAAPVGKTNLGRARLQVCALGAARQSSLWCLHRVRVAAACHYVPTRRCRPGRGSRRC